MAAVTRRIFGSGLAIVALLVTAWGGPSSHTATSVTSPSSGRTSQPYHSPAQLLFAVSEGPAAPFGPPNAIAIVVLDGQVRATAQVKPMPSPALGCGEGGYRPPVATTANGAVYYLSSDGVIRRLAPAGGVTDVGHLPILPDSQASWFAVSPDGKALMATIIAFPPVVSSLGCIQRQPGPTTVELLKGVAGGSFTVLTSDQQDASKSPAQGVLTVVGWDGIGAIASTDPAFFGIGSPSGAMWGQAAVHLDSSGHPGSPIGGTGCQPLYGIATNGDVLCYDQFQPTVKDGTGNLLWKLKALADSDGVIYGDVRISPDAAHVAFALDNNNFTFNTAVIRGRDGTRIGLPVPFQPEGWLDNDTVIGLTGVSKVGCSACPADVVFDQMAVVHVSNPTHIDKLGLKASFVGLVQPAG